MIIITSKKELKKHLTSYRKNKTITLIPTMGNLHQGHLELIKKAKKTSDITVISIFINPLQFSQTEDFNIYPKTDSEDKKRLIKFNCDVLFKPEIKTMYSQSSLKQHTRIITPELNNIHCGNFRPNHFDGVTTVVTKLFNIVNPNIAIFGLKDFQQFIIIKKIVKELYLPIKIIGMPTYRNEKGLALSSRNQYLNEKETKHASNIYRVLLTIGKKIKKGNTDFQNLEKNAITLFKKLGLYPEYFSICCQKTLKKATKKDRKIILLTAIILNKTRLIDNLILKI